MDWLDELHLSGVYKVNRQPYHIHPARSLRLQQKRFIKCSCTICYGPDKKWPERQSKGEPGWIRPMEIYFSPEKVSQAASRDSRIDPAAQESINFFLAYELHSLGYRRANTGTAAQVSRRDSGWMTARLKPQGNRT